MQRTQQIAEFANLRNDEMYEMTSLLDRPITAASDDGVYAAGTLPSCGRRAKLLK